MLPVLTTITNFDNDEQHLTKPYKASSDEYKVVLQTVKDYVGADCHAVVIDGEIVYNIYDDNLGYRQQIEEFVIREQIETDPHRHVFCPLFRQNKDFAVEIYLYKHDSMKLVIKYDHQTNLFHFTKKMR